MDYTQFKRLESAVQWAADESRQKKIRWDQGTWFNGEVNGKVKGKELRIVKVDCQSACCIAGNVVAEHGDKFVVSDYHEKGDHVGVDYVLTKEDKRYERVSARAEELLGIEDYEADELFSASNELHDILRIATRIASENGYALMIRSYA